MSSANVGWMFYKETFSHLDENSEQLNNDEVKKVNKKILNASLQHYEYPKGSHHAIQLKTSYPGLLIGTGYSHDAKGDENFKMGFFFDHTTGMPIIPASSIKGVLRSKFKMLNIEEKAKGVLSEFCCFYEELGLKAPTSGDLNDLENEVFEGEGKNSIYHRDIFYDAYPIETQDNNKLFYDDTLAHHESEFIDPNPIRFLKVAGEVVYRFGFDLHDGLLSADKKEELFLLMLQSSGVGAKTNVGYGQFEEFDIESFRTKRASQKILDDELSKSPTQKILDEYSGNMADIVAAYHQGLNERVSSFLDDFKKEILSHLTKELDTAKNKKKPKIEERIKKVQEW